MDFKETMEAYLDFKDAIRTVIDYIGQTGDNTELKRAKECLEKWLKEKEMP